MSYTILPARQAHVEALVPWVRGEIVAEVEASGFTSLEALELGLEVSTEAWVALLEGEVVAIWGVAPVPGEPHLHSVWMLNSHLVEARPRLFLRACRAEVARLLETYPALCNLVDDRYTRALRWAEWLGFCVGEPVPFGPEGVPFRPIVLRRDSPCAHP